MNMADTVLGPTPMQSFKGSNFAGVPTPKLANDSKAYDYSAEAATGPNELKHILLVSGAFIVIAYAVWHFMYEK